LKHDFAFGIEYDLIQNEWFANLVYKVAKLLKNIINRVEKTFMIS